MTNKNELILNAEQQEAIVRALLIGLESFGEIERLEDAVSRYRDAPIGDKLPNKFLHIHPTESADTIGVFAAALRYMNQV